MMGICQRKRGPFHLAMILNSFCWHFISLSCLSPHHSVKMARKHIVVGSTPAISGIRRSSAILNGKPL